MTTVLSQPGICARPYAIVTMPAFKFRARIGSAFGLGGLARARDRCATRPRQQTASLVSLGFVVTDAILEALQQLEELKRDVRDIKVSLASMVGMLAKVSPAGSHVRS